MNRKGEMTGERRAMDEETGGRHERIEKRENEYRG